ncbi:MAG: zinc ribbon domain-containing protein [Phycisphaerales bacterium]|nr:MAG: zinc ribbon domain-containing protein [Phycisphaerales bacterium]
MPLYEYRCEEDGTTIELLRPMAEADAPVDDPSGRGRSFKRVQSSFLTGESKTGRSDRNASRPHGGGCPCCTPRGCA